MPLTYGRGVTTAARLALAAALAGTAACGDDLVPDGGCGAGRHAVCGGWLRDPEGRAVVLRGVNLASVHKHAPYTDDFTPADYARLHGWGFRSLRFVVTWAAIEPAPGVYDDAYLDWVAERMRWAHDAGLTVVLDMHQDVYGEGFGYDGAPRWTCAESYYAAFAPREPWLVNYTDPNVLACFDHLWTDDALQASFAAMWRHVAARLADQPAIIGFDPLNEPHWGTHGVATFEVEALQPFYDRVIAAVRAEAPWVVFAEPSSARNAGFGTQLAPFAVPDVVYAPHMYDPMAEVTGAFDDARRAALLATAADLAGEAARLGVPLWIGEYGGIATSTAIGAYMDAAYDGAAAAFAGSTYWSYDRGGGYGLLDDAGDEIAALVDAVARPYPAAIAGEPLAWRYDEDARALEVSWRPDPAVAAPTVLIAPARAYPDGVDVTCAGCAVERAGDEIRIRTTAAEAIAILRPR